ncbi:MAG: type II toxin-antitoxin system RelE/ParE family toxin [Elusimicrobia bacterium]|nr:type II toxin-antitoxin system RelE/ParE family toxin [Elusimicrobiota bacterium]
MFQILYHPSVLREDFPHLNRNIKERLKAAIEHRLTRAPEDYGKPLRGELQSLWSLRVGDYRVVYRIDREEVKIIQIAHRRDAYEAGILEARRRGWL